MAAICHYYIRYYVLVTQGIVEFYNEGIPVEGLIKYELL